MPGGKICEFFGKFCVTHQMDDPKRQKILN